jgi:hypothetical protein
MRIFLSDAEVNEYNNGVSRFCVAKTANSSKAAELKPLANRSIVNSFSPDGCV